MTLKEGSLLGHKWQELKSQRQACVSIGSDYSEVTLRSIDLWKSH